MVIRWLSHFIRLSIRLTGLTTNVDSWVHGQPQIQERWVQHVGLLQALVNNTHCQGAAKMPQHSDTLRILPESPLAINVITYTQLFFFFFCNAAIAHTHMHVCAVHTNREREAQDQFYFLDHWHRRYKTIRKIDAKCHEPENVNLIGHLPAIKVTELVWSICLHSHDWTGRPADPIFGTRNQTVLSATVMCIHLSSAKGLSGTRTVHYRMQKVLQCWGSFIKSV